MGYFFNSREILLVIAGTLAQVIGVFTGDSIKTLNTSSFIEMISIYILCVLFFMTILYYCLLNVNEIVIIYFYKNDVIEYGEEIFTIFLSESEKSIDETDSNLVKRAAINCVKSYLSTQE